MVYIGDEVFDLNETFSKSDGVTSSEKEEEESDLEDEKEPVLNWEESDLLPDNYDWRKDDSVSETDLPEAAVEKKPPAPTKAGRREYSKAEIAAAIAALSSSDSDEEIFFEDAGATSLDYKTLKEELKKANKKKKKKEKDAGFSDWSDMSSDESDFEGEIINYQQKKITRNT